MTSCQIMTITGMVMMHMSVDRTTATLPLPASFPRMLAIWGTLTATGAQAARITAKAAFSRRCRWV